jgi:hypothetical protein
MATRRARVSVFHIHSLNHAQPKGSSHSQTASHEQAKGPRGLAEARYPLRRFEPAARDGAGRRKEEIWVPIGLTVTSVSANGG